MKGILRALLICLFLLLTKFIPVASAQLITIAENTIWTLANSPYIVSEVKIMPKRRLIIEPGVEVRFRSGGVLWTEGGVLIANGTEANRITFTSYETGKPGEWK